MEQKARAATVAREHARGRGRTDEDRAQRQQEQELQLRHRTAGRTPKKPMMHHNPEMETYSHDEVVNKVDVEVGSNGELGSLESVVVADESDASEAGTNSSP